MNIVGLEILEGHWWRWRWKWGIGNWEGWVRKGAGYVEIIKKVGNV